MEIIILILTACLILLTFCVVLSLVMCYDLEKKLKEAHFEIEQLEQELENNLPPF